MALTNMSSVQIPSPVFMSGVRFAAKLIPQGPANAVLVAKKDANQGPGVRFRDPVQANPTDARSRRLRSGRGRIRVPSGRVAVAVVARSIWALSPREKGNIWYSRDP